jgi:splicing factor 3A subunit 1
VKIIFNLKNIIETIPKKDLPLPPNPENVIVRRDYDPKNKVQSASSLSKGAGGSEEYFKSPLTGELIPASSMSEHMRISMLDPRWIETRKREQKQRDEQEEVLASGSSIEKHLKRMADYRSDIFGSGADEALIGRKVGEIEEEKNNAMEDIDESTWTETVTPKKTSNEVQIESNQMVNQTSFQSNNNQMSQQTIMLSNYKILNVPAGNNIKPPAPFAMDYQRLPQQQQQHQMLINPLDSLQPSLIQEPIIIPDDEPSNKRLKTEDQLIPEAKFLEMHSGKGPITFHVQAPSVPDKPEWNLENQLIPITMELTDTVASIKNKITELLSMPIAKQKLQLDVRLLLLFQFFVIFILII